MRSSAQPVAELARHYEDLRSGVTDARTTTASGLGVTLLMTRGLPAWMKAWSVCIPEGARCAPRDAVPPLPPIARPEVVHLLTGMALAACTETRP